jgi:hypothetical protein
VEAAPRLGGFQALLGGRATERECDRRERLRNRDGTRETREEAGGRGRLEQQHVVGAFGHRRREAVRDRDQRCAGTMGGLRNADARMRVGQEADDDDGFAGTKGAEIEIVGAGCADELHLFGTEQPELVVQELRDAPAASVAGNPDPLGVVQRAGCIRNRLGRNAQKAGALGLELVGDERDIGVRAVTAALGAAGER